ncbi:SLAM family member 5 isoform X3 [Myotis myotis]|uniref:SLAM family member 5 isoform X3 n=1 Tax=Myotis myotis TaxID=51298 RepID=UPI00174C9813|nr:SLAM family member 5 isoform X3 [Myotis myotis]
MGGVSSSLDKRPFGSGVCDQGQDSRLLLLRVSLECFPPQPLLRHLKSALSPCTKASGLEAAESNTNMLTVNGILGETVTFPLNIQNIQQITSINWVSSKTSVAVVVALPSAPPQVIVTHQNYKQRVNVSSQNYNLEISNLRMEDAAIYKADINTKNSEKETLTRTYKLQVYRRLGKPKITQSLTTSSNSTCNVTLTCSMEKEEKNVTYTWSPMGTEGSVLQVFQTPNNQELTYTCTAWNPVSNNSDSISAQQLCAGSSFKIFHKKPDAASKNTIYTYVNAPRDPQPAELRIYDEISQPKVDKTISTQDSKPSRTPSYVSVI